MTQESPADDGFPELIGKIAVERGFACASYKQKCLRRRIGVRMRARGVHRYGDYSAILDTDETEYDRLLDALTINVTRFFRNWEAWETLAAVAIPELWHSDRDRVRVWSAGCSSGEEPYSVAALFHRHAAVSGMLPQFDRLEVIGTDIDRRSLDAAERAEYCETDFVDAPRDMRTRYFAPEAPFSPVATIRAACRFERWDLLGGTPPWDPVQLIICRNVLIYFDRESQERIFATFHSMLEPGGFLFLGKVETLLGAARAKFASVNARDRLFRRA